MSLVEYYETVELVAKDTEHTSVWESEPSLDALSQYIWGLSMCPWKDSVEWEFNQADGILWVRLWSVPCVLTHKRDWSYAAVKRLLSLASSGKAGEDFNYTRKDLKMAGGLLGRQRFKGKIRYVLDVKRCKKFIKIEAYVPLWL